MKKKRKAREFWVPKDGYGNCYPVHPTDNKSQPNFIRVREVLPARKRASK